jgi:hypothetical protein
MLRKVGLVVVLAALAACTKSATSGPSSPPSPIASAGSTGPSASTSPTVASTSPAALPIVQANFVDTVDNPWFPLTPGTTLTYEGVKDGKPSKDVFEITGESKVIDGVRCVVVRDTLTMEGKLHEQTEDWYTQDVNGNVWYFGEDTREFDAKGNVKNTSGTWQAGVDGAIPGIFMPADPQTGVAFQQEYLAGEAEDHFVVLHRLGAVDVPYGSFEDVLVTAEWTPLEPDVLSEKFYVKGLGMVKELDVAGSDEKNALVSVKTA